MTKKTVSLRIEETILDEFTKTGINRSKFCEDCMKAYISTDEKGLGRRIQSIDEDIRQLEYRKYILTSRYSQDYERNQEILGKIPELWKEFTSKAGDLFFGLCDVEEFDNLRGLSGLLKRDLIDLAEYLVDKEDNEDYNLLCTDFKYCLKQFNKDNDRNMRGDLL